MRQLLVNSAVVAIMLGVYFALSRQGVPVVGRLVAMGVVSAVLLGVARAARKRAE